VVRAEMLKARDKVSLIQFCTGSCEDRTWARRKRNSHCWSHYQETSSNRLRTLHCVP
jgi:hypothetical protein